MLAKTQIHLDETMLNLTAVGRLASDPRTNTVNEREVTNFTVLCNRKIKGEDLVTQLECAVWGKRAPVAFEFLKKGSQVTVVGEAHVEQYQRNNGEPGAKLVVNVADFALPPKPQGETPMPF